jgi:hypothetical protein
MPPAASRAPVSLSARVSLIRLWSPMSPPYCPRTCPLSGAPFPPRGPSGWFPRFIGNTKHSDFLPSLPRHFVSFVSRYRRCALGFVPAGARRYRLRARGCSPESPNRIHQRRRTGPPRFLEDPDMNVPCSSTPAESSRSTATARRYCLPPLQRRRPPQSV